MVSHFLPMRPSLKAHPCPLVSSHNVLYSGAGLPNTTLGILGTKITLHEDALGTISSAVESNLLLLGSDEDNRVDRFDVRLLLDDRSGVISIRWVEHLLLHDRSKDSMHCVQHTSPCQGSRDMIPRPWNVMAAGQGVPPLHA